MGEAVAAGASIVGLVVPALHGTRLMLEDIANIVNAPDTVKSLKEDLTSLDATLKSLETVDEAEWESLGTTVVAQVKVAISTSERACRTFSSDLQQWTRRSRGGKLSRRDQINIGFFKGKQIKAVSSHLQSCKLTCSNVVAIATLYSSIRHSHVTQEIREAIAKKETELTSLSQATDTRLSNLEKSLGDMESNDVDQGNAECEESQDRLGAIAQLEQEVAVLKASQALLPELLSRLKSEEIEKIAGRQTASTNVSFGNNNHGFQIGVNRAAISGVTFGK